MANMNIKNSIKNNIVAMDAHFRGATEKVALVKKSNEKNNTCTIEFKDFDGNLVMEKDVKIKLSSPSIVDWFPQKGDYVFITEDLNNVMITGDATHLVTNNSKKQTSFVGDLFSNLVAQNTGGFII